MKKMLIIFTILTITVVLLLKSRIDAPTQTYPYPYLLKSFDYPQKEEAENTDILIFGDRMALQLSPYLNNEDNDFFDDKGVQLKVFNWADDSEGMHRSLHKLRSLKSLPKLIIYHGASSEYFEKKIDPQNYTSIKRNFKLIENDIILSLIMLLPELSKILFAPFKHILLSNKIKKDQRVYSDIDKQKLKEIKFKIFSYELIEFIQEVIDRGSNLLIITTPINYEVRPKSSCSYGKNNANKELINNIKSYIEKGETKTAYSLSKKLIKVYPTDPMAHYYKAKTAASLGMKKEALEHFKFASVYDCKNWRGNAVLAKIMENQIKEYDIETVDFHQLINQYLGQNTLFLDDIFPQNIYYKEMIINLKTKIKNILKVKK